MLTKRRKIGLKFALKGLSLKEIKTIVNKSSHTKKAKKEIIQFFKKKK